MDAGTPSGARRGTRHGLRVAAALVLLATAVAFGATLPLSCRGETKPEPVASRVLQPLTVSAGAPTAEQALAERVVAEMPFDKDLGSWSLEGGEARPVPSGLVRGGEDVRGLIVRTVDDRTPEEVERGVERRRTALETGGLSFAADEVTALVLRAAFNATGTARLVFTTAEELESGVRFPAANSIDIPTRPSLAPVDWAFDVAGHPAWKGEIVALRIYPLSRPSEFIVSGLEAIDRDLAPGSTPRLDGDGRPLDVGLVRLGRELLSGETSTARYEARRAYPALAGEDQFVFAGAERLGFSFALPPTGLDGFDGPVRFEVRWAGLPPGEPGDEDVDLAELALGSERLFARELDPEEDGGRWFAGSVELPDPAASGAERGVVFLRTEGGRPPGRVNGLWAALRRDPLELERALSVLLITADTLRADHVGAYGAEDADTPVMDALAERGVLFEDVLAQCNSTSPSHATILTGLYPKDHRVLGNKHVLPDEVLSIAEVMRSSGRFTFASTAVRHLDSQLSGMGQGFDVYLDTPPAVSGRDPYRGAGESNELIFDVLDEIGEAPFFGWVHYYDPHTPYAPEHEYQVAHWQPDGTEAQDPILDRLAEGRAALHPSLRTERGPDGAERALGRAELVDRFVADHPHMGFLRNGVSEEYFRAMYRAEIAQLDRDLGRLFDALEERGRLEDTIVVFTSDHGEALGERDIWFNHEGVYENTLRIPLILAGPGVPRGVRRRAPVESTDIVPTVAELVDLPLASPVRGVSLVELFDSDGADVDRERWFQYAENSETGFRTRDEHFLRSNREHRRGSFDVVVPEGDVELYDLSESELRDVSGDRLDRARDLSDRVEAWLDDRLIQVESREAVLSAEDEAALEALGYTGD